MKKTKAIYIFNKLEICLLTFIKNCTYCKMSSVYTIVINRTNSGVYLYNWVQKRHRNDADGRPKISLNVQKKAE